MTSENRIKKVFIPVHSSHDYSAAEEYGQLIYLSESSINKFNTNTMFLEFSETLEDAEADDYLLVTALGVMNCIATAIMIKKFNRVNFLLYNGGEYIDRSISLD